MNTRMKLPAILVLAFAFGVAGCYKKNVKKTDTPENPSASAAQAPDGTAAAGVEDSDSEPNIRDGLPQVVSGLKTIRFDYDSAQLSDSARTTLAANSQWLKENTAVRVQVAGHCDQRGTVEYNLTLGQKRAKAVRDYYRSLGIPGSRVATISYGREKPACHEETESCWGQNRRAETLAVFSSSASDQMRRRRLP